MQHNSTDHKAMPAVSTILVVGDEIVIRALVSEFLRDEGYIVIEASDTDEAATIVATKVPDLIVTDLRNPDARDGFELRERVRAFHATVPLIITSTKLADTADVANGRTHFLSKPYRLDALTELIQFELADRQEGGEHK